MHQDVPPPTHGHEAVGPVFSCSGRRTYVIAVSPPCVEQSSGPAMPRCSADVDAPLLLAAARRTIIDRGSISHVRHIGLRDTKALPPDGSYSRAEGEASFMPAYSAAASVQLKANAG